MLIVEGKESVVIVNSLKMDVYWAEYFKVILVHITYIQLVEALKIKIVR
jgi:hypothetical protein